MDDYLPSMRAKNSDGVSLPILSPDELSYALRTQTRKDLDITEKIVTTDDLQRIMTNQNESSAKQPTKGDKIKAQHYVGILLPQIKAEHFDEVIIRWIEPVRIAEKAKHLLSLRVGGQHIIPPTTTSSIYIDVSMDHKKYEILEDPTVWADDPDGNKKDPVDGDEYRKILQTNTQFVYRIKRNCTSTFTIKWFIGIPSFVRKWAWAGLLVSLGILALSILTFIQDPSTYVRNSTLLAGLVGLIIGFRVLLFHDTELMRRWNYLYMILLAISVGTILGITFIH